MFATRHYVDLSSDIIHVVVLEEFHVNNLDSADFVIMGRVRVSALGLPHQAEGSLTDGADELVARCLGGPLVLCAFHFTT